MDGSRIFLYMAIDGMIKPFLYRKSVQAYREYSVNTISYNSKAYKNGKQYRISIRPDHPEKFVTRKWGAFFASFFFWFMVIVFAETAWKLFMQIIKA